MGVILLVRRRPVNSIRERFGTSGADGAVEDCGSHVAGSVVPIATNHVWVE